MGENIFSQYLKDIKRYPLLTAQEELCLADKIQNGDRGALQQLINSNLRLVVKMAKDRTPSENLLMDLIQEGNMGLMIAAEKFSSSFNARFSSYACWWIRQSLNRYLNGKHETIRLPFRKADLLRKIEKTIDLFKEKYRRTPSYEEIAEIIQVPLKSVIQICVFTEKPISFDSPLQIHFSANLYDLTENNDYNPEKEYFRKVQIEAFRKFLQNTLKSREKDIIEERLPITDKNPKSLRSLGIKYGISAESVRQTEIRALKKLRMHEKYLKSEFFY
ncbi:sigma-70 family RNA polymerase sigma factor [Treponema phagedenis]|uniref:sigma-70 family RNA polymerase sigma factor n=1 Tax=Treponema phagedenis TaxID=162 RepID=UPI0001F640BD|nr:RNA polymerase sigma factor RpoD/SigA [Treponema phagedenis]EFW37250.1 Sigma-70 region 2 [Treponema phagedenis F0421]TYT79965.1 RNA polymerase sigma factor RpoD/SigA [Treponema phagedenis]